MAKSACPYAVEHELKENFDDLVGFMNVARERNFTRAAAQLGVSQSALSRTVAALEKRMGLQLLTRTTRSVSLTEAGERLLAAIAPRFQEIEAEVDALRAMTNRPSGTVRITTTDYAANTYVWPRLQPLLRQYPELKIELVNDYGLTDIVADRYDIGVRLGDQVAKDMIAVRIAPDMTMAIVGAPRYLKSAAPANTPQDLTQHNCINLRLPTRDSLLAWELKKGRRELQVRVEGQLIFTSVYQMMDAALGCIRPQGSCGRACPGRALMLGAGRLVSYVRRTSRLLPESTQIVAGRRACRGGVEERLFASHAVSGKATATRQIVAVESPRVMATGISRTDVAQKKRRLKQAASNGDHVLRCAWITARKVIQRRHGCRRRYHGGSAQRDSVNRPKRDVRARSRPDCCVDRA